MHNKHVKAHNSFRSLAACAALLVILSSSILAAQSLRSSSPEAWPIAVPEEAGFDSGPLVEMFDFVRERQIPVHSVQLVRRGRLVLDAYFHPYDGKTRHDIASVTKSVTSTLVGLAIERGHIRNVHQPVLDFFPEYTIARMEARKAQANARTSPYHAIRLGLWLRAQRKALVRNASSAGLDAIHDRPPDDGRTRHALGLLQR